VVPKERGKVYINRKERDTVRVERGKKSRWEGTKQLELGDVGRKKKFTKFYIKGHYGRAWGGKPGEKAMCRQVRKRK